MSSKPLANGEVADAHGGVELTDSLKPIANLPPEDQLTALIDSGLSEVEALESWKLLHSAPAVCAPFVQRADTPAGGHEVYPWLQLSGHQGNFRPGPRGGTVLKLLCQCEVDCLQLLARDRLLSDFVPKYYGTVRLPVAAAGETGSQGSGGYCEYVEMQDLLAEFPGCTGLMDCKMGSRTYLESELGGDAKPRRDLYEKMVEVDPEAPTPEEAAARAVSKPRYMIWREQLSSTASLAFRIDGLHRLTPTGAAGGSSAGAAAPVPDLKRLRLAEDVAEVLALFVDGRADLRDAYLARLRSLRQALAASEFFARREVISSSLLFAHDQSPGHASVWMIDFGKSQPSPVPISHTAEWQEGNHEDGYLTGLDSLISMFASLTVSPSHPPV